MTAAVVQLSADMSAVETALTKLNTGLSALAEAGELSAHAINRFLGLLDSGEQLFTLEFDGTSAAAAYHLTMVAEPTDGLSRLLAAVGTGDFNLAVFEELLSQLESSIGVSNPMVAEPEASRL